MIERVWEVWELDIDSQSFQERNLQPILWNQSQLGESRVVWKFYNKLGLPIHVEIFYEPESSLFSVRSISRKSPVVVKWWWKTIGRGVWKERTCEYSLWSLCKQHWAVSPPSKVSSQNGRKSSQECHRIFWCVPHTTSPNTQKFSVVNLQNAIR